MPTLTTSFIDKLTAPPSGNRVYWDDERERRGFGIRITAGGVKSFVYEYTPKRTVEVEDEQGRTSERVIEGNRRRYTIGQYPEWSLTAALGKLEELKKEIREGIDPLEVKAEMRKAPTMEELCMAYTSSRRFRKKRATSQRDDRAKIDRIIVPRFGSKRVAAISKAAVEKLHDEMEATPYQANRVLALLSTLFNFAKSEGFPTGNPAKGVERHPEHQRENKLTIPQMVKLYEAMTEYAKRTYKNKDEHKDDKQGAASGKAASAALRLLMLTGSRLNEVLVAGWSEFDLERGWWAKPAANVKQKKDTGIPLSGAAVRILDDLKSKENRTGPVFPSEGERVLVDKPWDQCCAAAGLAEKYQVPSFDMYKKQRIDKKTGEPIMLDRYRNTIRIHDLRHAFASYLVSRGHSLVTIGRLLGHKASSSGIMAITARYADPHDEVLRAAVEDIAAMLEPVEDVRELPAPSSKVELLPPSKSAKLLSSSVEAELKKLRAENRRLQKQLAAFA